MKGGKGEGDSQDSFLAVKHLEEILLIHKIYDEEEKVYGNYLTKRTADHLTEH